MSKEYTVEQETIVRKVLAIEKSDYYKLLDVSKSATEVEIKKSYRKMAIKLHPDKNKHPHSAEAFKKLAKAFEILSDSDKRKIFDQTGYDPDSRGSQSASSPFSSGFANTSFQNRFGRGGPDVMFDENIFDFLFQSARGPQGFAFGNGFNNNGFSFQFGGPGARPQTFRQNNTRRQQDEEKSLLETITQLLPLLLFILVPIISNFFSGESSSQLPRFSFNPQRSLPVERETPKYHVPYYISKNTFEGYRNSAKRLSGLDTQVENYYVKDLRTKCRREQQTKERLIEESYGWFFVDSEKLSFAQNLELPNCDRLTSLNLL